MAAGTAREAGATRAAGKLAAARGARGAGLGKPRLKEPRVCNDGKQFAVAKRRGW